MPRELKALMAIADEAQRSLRAYTSAKTALEKLSMQSSSQRMAGTVGKATAAVFTCFVGDPTLFPSAASYVKSFGLNLKEKSSGKHVGRLKITKRGSNRAWQYIWLAACRWIQQDLFARTWYQKKVRRDGGGKSKALVAVMRKLAQALFHIGRGDQYDPRKLFNLENLGLQT